MPRTFSTGYNEQLNAVSGTDPQLILLEITHDDLATPIRLVNDGANLVSNGDTYYASQFTYSIPDDRDAGLPKAALSFANVGNGPEGNSLAAFLDLNDGGRGSLVTMRGVRLSAPDDVEFEFVLDLTQVRVTQAQITGTLGYDDLLNRPAVAVLYRPDVAPGLF